MNDQTKADIAALKAFRSTTESAGIDAYIFPVTATKKPASGSWKPTKTKSRNQVYIPTERLVKMLESGRRLALGIPRANVLAVDIDIKSESHPLALPPDAFERCEKTFRDQLADYIIHEVKTQSGGLHFFVGADQKWADYWGRRCQGGWNFEGKEAGETRAPIPADRKEKGGGYMMLHDVAGTLDALRKYIELGEDQKHAATPILNAMFAGDKERAAQPVVDFDRLRRDGEKEAAALKATTEIDWARAAIDYINPDLGRGDWLHVAMSLKSEFGDAGKELWIDWSKKGKKWTHKPKKGESGKDQADRVWDSIDQSGGITIATLYKLAQDAGWPGKIGARIPRVPKDRPSRPNGATPAANPVASTNPDPVREAVAQALDQIDGNLIVDESLGGKSWACARVFVKGKGWKRTDHKRRTASNIVGLVLDKYCESEQDVRSGMQRIYRLTSHAVDWDANLGSVLAAGKVYDLKTGESRPVANTDYILQELGGDPEMVADKDLNRWAGYLNDWWEAPERAFLQLWCGAGITGYGPELNKFLMIHGEGGEGKSRFAQGVLGAAGGYGRTVDKSVFVKTRDKHSSFLAAMQGGRLVFTSEAARGGVLDDLAMRSLTGGDAVQMRKLYTEPVTVEPTWLPAFLVNDRLQVDKIDEAIRRRVLVLPILKRKDFTPDLTLPRVLKSDGMRNAIAWWLLNGAKRFLERQADKKTYNREPDRILGITPDSVIGRTTNDWLEDVDLPKRFYAEYVDAAVEYVPRELVDAFKDWCEAEGRGAANNTRKRELNRLMKTRHVKRGRKRKWTPRD